MMLSAAAPTFRRHLRRRLPNNCLTNHCYLALFVTARTATAASVATRGYRTALFAAEPSLAAFAAENALSSSHSMIEDRGELSPRYVARIIGRGGETIRDLESRSGCTISINQNDDGGAAATATPRVITYRGSRREDVDLAKYLVGILCDDGKFHRENASLPLGRATMKQIEVSRSAASKIIGPGGEIVRELQSDSNARIQVSRVGAFYRIVTITGTKVAVAKAEKMIVKLLSAPNVPTGSNSGIGSSPDEEHNENVPFRETNGHDEAGIARQVKIIHVPKSAAGRIIGAGGAMVRALQGVSRARIQIDHRSGESRQVTITGTKDAVEMAKEMMMKFLPPAYNSTTDAGGGAGDAATAAAAAAAAATDGHDPVSGGNSASTDNGNDTNPLVREGRNDDVFGEAGRPLIVKQIWVSKPAAGRIIGPRGEMVRLLESASRTWIRVDDNRGDVRPVTITGTTGAITAAKDLIIKLVLSTEINGGGHPNNVLATKERNWRRSDVEEMLWRKYDDGGYDDSFSRNDLQNQNEQQQQQQWQHQQQEQERAHSPSVEEVSSSFMHLRYRPANTAVISTSAPYFSSGRVCRANHSNLPVEDSTTPPNDYFCLLTSSSESDDWMDRFWSHEYDNPYSPYYAFPKETPSTTFAGNHEGHQKNVVSSVLGGMWERRRHGMNLEPMRVLRYSSDVCDETDVGSGHSEIGSSKQQIDYNTTHTEGGDSAGVEAEESEEAWKRRRMQWMDAQTRFLCRMLDDLYRTGTRRETDRPRTERCHRAISRLLTMTPEDHRKKSEVRQAGITFVGLAQRAGAILQRMEQCSPPVLRNKHSKPTSMAATAAFEQIINVEEVGEGTLPVASYQGLYLDHPRHLLHMKYALPTPTRQIYNMVLLAYGKESGEYHVAQQAEDVVWSMIVRMMKHQPQKPRPQLQQSKQESECNKDGSDKAKQQPDTTLFPSLENWNCVLKCWSRSTDPERSFHAYTFLLSWMELNRQFQGTRGNEGKLLRVDEDMSDWVVNPTMESFHLVLESCLVESRKQEETVCKSQHTTEPYRRERELGSVVAIRLWKEILLKSLEITPDSKAYHLVIQAICQTTKLPSSSSKARALQTLVRVYSKCHLDGMTTPEIIDLVRGATTESQFIRMETNLDYSE